MVITLNILTTHSEIGNYFLIVFNKSWENLHFIETLSGQCEMFSDRKVFILLFL